MRVHVYLSLDTQRLTIVTIAGAEREGQSLITNSAYLTHKRGADEDNRPIAFGAYGKYKRGAEVKTCPFTSAIRSLYCGPGSTIAEFHDHIIELPIQDLRHVE